MYVVCTEQMGFIIANSFNERYLLVMYKLVEDPMQCNTPTQWDNCDVLSWSQLEWIKLKIFYFIFKNEIFILSNLTVSQYEYPNIYLYCTVPDPVGAGWGRKTARCNNIISSGHSYLLPSPPVTRPAPEQSRTHFYFDFPLKFWHQPSEASIHQGLY